jgi:Ca2+-binding EF-hand superfamily protein
MEINFGFKKADPNQEDTRPRLRDFDTDKNGSLDATEFANVVERPVFSVMDTNRDEKISAEEFDGYQQQRSKAVAVQILLDVTEQGSDLFRTFDQNGDRVLTPRELLSAPKLLETEDQNRDGFLGGAEMSYNLELLLTRGTPRTQQNANLAARRVAQPRVKADRNGPSWFLKMDRNRDGDVGLPEFPGNRQAFTKLDTNHDGLLSSDEATAISTTGK